MMLEFIKANWEQDGPNGPDHRYRYLTLWNRKIMAVASVDLRCNLWRVYIDAVPGHRNDREWQAVASGGTKVFETQAREWFPNMPEELEYAE